MHDILGFYYKRSTQCQGVILNEMYPPTNAVDTIVSWSAQAEQTLILICPKEICTTRRARGFSVTNIQLCEAIYGYHIPSGVSCMQAT